MKSLSRDLGTTVKETGFLILEGGLLRCCLLVEKPSFCDSPISLTLQASPTQTLVALTSVMAAVFSLRVAISAGFAAVVFAIFLHGIFE